MTDKHPVDLTVSAPEKSSRFLALLTLLFFVPKTLILIPHLIVLWALGIAAFVVGALAQVIVLVTGTYPPQMHEFVTAVIRWQVRVNVYLFGLRDEYPPFTFKK